MGDVLMCDREKAGKQKARMKRAFASTLHHYEIRRELQRGLGKDCAPSATTLNIVSPDRLVVKCQEVCHINVV